MVLVSLRSYFSTSKLLNLNGKSASSRILDFIGHAHDIKSYNGNLSHFGILTSLLISHFAHLSSVFMWLAGNLFHIGWTGNFSCWLLNPPSTLALAHSVWDPHLYESFYFYELSSTSTSVTSHSGLYHWLYSIGVRSEYQVFSLVLCFELLSLLFLITS